MCHTSLTWLHPLLPKTISRLRHVLKLHQCAARASSALMIYKSSKIDSRTWLHWKYIIKLQWNEKATYGNIHITKPRHATKERPADIWFSAKIQRWNQISSSLFLIDYVYNSIFRNKNFTCRILTYLAATIYTCCTLKSRELCSRLLTCIATCILKEGNVMRFRFPACISPNESVRVRGVNNSLTSSHSFCAMHAGNLDCEELPLYTVYAYTVRGTLAGIYGANKVCRYT